MKQGNEKQQRFSMKVQNQILVGVGCFWAVAATAQQPVDTSQVYRLPEVVVAERYQTREVRASAPLQVLSAN